MAVRSCRGVCIVVRQGKTLRDLSLPKGHASYDLCNSSDLHLLPVGMCCATFYIESWPASTMLVCTATVTIDFTFTASLFFLANILFIRIYLLSALTWWRNR